MVYDSWDMEQIEGADRRTEIRMNGKTDVFKQFYKMLHT